MPSAVESVLSELGWSDGFRIPIANAANKRLEEEIERKTRERCSLRSQLESLEERISDIRKHASDVRQEHSQNQRLLAAHSAQIESEKHLYRLSQMDESRLNQEAKRCDKQTRETDEKAAALQQKAAKLARKLELTKRNIRLDKESLANWEEKLSKTEEKNLVIEQFVKSDEKTFKKVELERQNLSEKAEAYRQAVLKADADVRESELMLDRTARFYSQAVKDRRQLMDQWSQSVRVLTQRDKSIYDTLQEISQQREVAKRRMDAYQEAERFFGIQVSENKELECGIKALERDLGRQREERQALAESIEALSIELVAKNKELQEVARRTEGTRANTKRKRRELEEKRAQLDDCKKRIGELKGTLKSIDGQTMNVEERTRQLQDMLEKEEKRKSLIHREIKRQQDLILRANGRLRELENEQKVVAMQRQAEAKRWEQLLSEQAKQKKLLKEKKEWAYQADLELQRCELRLQVTMGQERDKKELEAKQNKIRQLSQSLQEKSETLRTLQAQVAQVEHEVRRMTSAIAGNKEELEQLRAKRQELSLLLEGGERQLRAAQLSCEDRQVEESVVRLKLREVERLATRVDDKLFSLEKFGLEMEAAMRERVSEIKAQRESLALRRRLAQADCAELRRLLAERRSRIQQLQARYELTTACLGSNPEDGSPLTATYLKVQSAQERYLLQERGDQLDRTCRKTELEIQSMENTLKLVNACNSKYKSSLSLVEDSGPEKAEQSRLDEEMFRGLEMLAQKRRELERAQQDCKRMEENCAQLDEDVKRAKEERESKRQTVADLEQQITEQQDKISRADKSLRKILKDIENKCACTADESMLLHERDIALRELQELNQLALQRIAEFTIRHVEAEAYVKKRLEERGIGLPSAYYLRLQPSRCESAASSLANSSRPTLGLSTARDTVGSFVQLEPQFGALDSAKSSKTVGKNTQRQFVKKKLNN